MHATCIPRCTSAYVQTAYGPCITCSTPKLRYVTDVRSLTHAHIAEGAHTEMQRRTIPAYVKNTSCPLRRRPRVEKGTRRPQSELGNRTTFASAQDRCANPVHNRMRCTAFAPAACSKLVDAKLLAFHSSHARVHPSFVAGGEPAPQVNDTFEVCARHHSKTIPAPLFCMP